MTRRKTGVLAGMALWGLASCVVAAELPGSTRQVVFRIDSPTMTAALIQFSEQAGLQLVFPTAEGAVQIHAPRVEGTLTPRAALEQLLRDSGLQYEFVNARTVLVSSPAQGSVRASGAAP